MNKIKTVKIKNEDGSISEESYNISIDARNVDMDNGKDLQQTIGNIDVDNDGSISTQLKNIRKTDNPIYYGADPTGNIDSSNAINRCIQANKGGTINFEAGRYLINQTINLPYRNNEKVSINGNGATIINNNTLNRLFYFGFDKGIENNNDVGFPCYIKDLNIIGENSNTTYAIDIKLGFKDLKIFNCRLYRFLNGIRIGETGGTPADVLISDCLIYGKGSEYDGTGIISNCTDNNADMCRIYGFRKGFLINGYITITKCQVLLRWANQTTSNFDPYERNGTDWNNYYPLTKFADIYTGCRIMQSYADSVYNFININTDSYIIFTNNFHFNARKNVDNRSIIFNLQYPKVIIDGNDFDLGSNEHGEIIYCANGYLTNYAQVNITNSNIVGITRLTNPFDLVYSSIPKFHANLNLTADTWYILGVLSNCAPDSNFAIELFLNNYYYHIRITAGNLTTDTGSNLQLLYVSSDSKWYFGFVTIDNNLLLCVKPTQDMTNRKFDYNILASDNFVIRNIPILHGYNAVESSRKLSDYTNKIPQNEIRLKEVIGQV